jgi:cell wall-associated NlpC family hydrolase
MQLTLGFLMCPSLRKLFRCHMNARAIATYSISEARQLVVNIARSFVGTPYHKNGRIKGVGVDCATFIFCAYKEAGLVSAEEEGIFSDPSIVPTSQDWFCNTDEDKYMKRILRHAHKVAEGVSYPSLRAEPGNIALTRAVRSKVFNHGGIVTRWPKVVHAVDPITEEADASSHALWAFQEVVILDPFGEAA